MRLYFVINIEDETNLFKFFDSIFLCVQHFKKAGQIFMI